MLARSWELTGLTHNEHYSSHTTHATSILKNKVEKKSEKKFYSIEYLGTYYVIWQIYCILLLSLKMTIIQQALRLKNKVEKSKYFFFTYWASWNLRSYLTNLAYIWSRKLQSHNALKYVNFDKHGQEKYINFTVSYLRIHKVIWQIYRI
jgi:hypothetical protein